MMMADNDKAAMIEALRAKRVASAGMGGGYKDRIKAIDVEIARLEQREA